MKTAPEGTIQKLTFSESRIFPGTVREVTVFIPAQYDGSSPACVYVRQDGFNPAEKPFLEQLIAEGAMPVTVGVFVTPGNLPPPEGHLQRRNRCFEYDGVGDRFARFLDGEILPFVERSCGVRLSRDGNDRCIGGASSGGISAFNAAWERPDLFTRVYANSGSFVAFRGGHELPTLVRKFEPQPIRAYLTTATHDMENCAGDWYLIDQEMEKALAFSGYDYRFKTEEGEHCAGWEQNFCEAMRYLWSGWPAAIPAGTGAPRVRDVLVSGKPWAPLPGDFNQPASPVCNSKGEVYFLEGNRILRIAPEGCVTLFSADAAQASGLAVGANDELYSVSTMTGDILRYGPDGKTAIVARGVPGLYALAMPTGGLYVSNPDGARPLSWVKDGQVKEVATSAKGPSGLALRPDHWLLSVADSRSKWVFSAQVMPDGSLANEERFFWLHVADWDDDAGAGSVAFAREGQMLVATRRGVQICADDGPTQVILPLPDRSRVTGVCLGGPEGATLYAFAEGKIWQRPVQIHGVGAFSPAVKLTSTPL